MLDIGWFSTGRGEGSLGLLRFIQDRISIGEIDARIQFVFSNREPGEAEGSDRFFQQVRNYRLPLVTSSSRKYRRESGGKLADHRVEYDREVNERIKDFNPDVCVLAGYMLIVGAEMCHRYTMLNLHPALPSGPVGTWQEVIWSLIGSGAEKTGAMIHLVTEDVDRGPVITYFTLPITGEAFVSHWRQAREKSLPELREKYGEDLPLFRLIRQEGYRREPYLLAATLQAVDKGMVRVKGGRILGSDGEPLEGLCLDREINEALASS